jgi:hypothetical protein
VIKAIITGPPFCGKSTLVGLLRTSYPHIVVKELDEMLIGLNGGKWPSDEPYRNGILVPRVIENVLSKDDDFLFFTTYINPESIQYAKDKGFSLIQLLCSREILVRRNIKNDESRQHEMDKNLEYQLVIKNQKLVDKEIDCSKSPEEIIKVLMDFLENKRV